MFNRPYIETKELMYSDQFGLSTAMEMEGEVE